jgi:general secretion pathway protein B
MSLILDALKKSEAERRRGLPPSLHAQFGAPRRARRAPWAAGAGAVLLVAGLTGSWFWLARDPGQSALDANGNNLAEGSASPPSVAEAVAPALTAAVQAPSAADTTPAGAKTNLADASSRPAAESALGGVGGGAAGGSVSGGGLPVPQRAILYTPSAAPMPQTAGAAPPPMPTTATPPPMPAGPPPESVAAATVATTPAGPSSDPGAVAEAPAAPSVAVDQRPEEVLPMVYQLPYATRKDLPKLSLSMHVYSPIVSERFIVLNGKRFTMETPAPGPELTLLDIVAEGAVLEFRGQRFLLPTQAY